MLLCGNATRNATRTRSLTSRSYESVAGISPTMNPARRSRSAMRRFGSRCFWILSMSLWMERLQLLLQPTMQEPDASAPSATKDAKARASDVAENPRSSDAQGMPAPLGYGDRHWRPYGNGQHRGEP